jgi:hypothetical protein
MDYSTQLGVRTFVILSKLSTGLTATDRPEQLRLSDRACYLERPSNHRAGLDGQAMALDRLVVEGAAQPRPGTKITPTHFRVQPLGLPI